MYIGIGILLHNLELPLTLVLLYISILLYADDIVLLAPSPENLQAQVDIVSEWCRKWSIKINVAKTNAIHSHKKSRNRQRPSHVIKTNGALINYIHL